MDRSLVDSQPSDNPLVSSLPMLHHSAMAAPPLCEICGSVPPSLCCCAISLCKRCKRRHDSEKQIHSNPAAAQTSEAMQKIVKTAVEQDARISEMGDLYLETKQVTEAEITRLSSLNQQLMDTLDQVSEENKTLRQLCEKYKEIVSNYEDEKKTSKQTPAIPKGLAKPTLRRQTNTKAVKPN